MNVKLVSDQTLILEAQYISQNDGSVRNGKDLSTIDHVWILITSIYVFSCLQTLTKTPITNGIIYVLTLSSVLITLDKPIYLLSFSFPLLTIL